MRPEPPGRVAARKPGFTQVYNYAAGKADWLAAGLPREGEHAAVPVIGDIARRDVPTCGLEGRIEEVEKQIQASGWDQCVVVNAERVVLGRARHVDLGGDPNATIEQVMQEGPSTFRPNVNAHEMVEYMRGRGEMSDTLVTDPEGRLNRCRLAGRHRGRHWCVAFQSQ